ncbi:hypothetical protein GCM10027187_17450 [Streptosporangium sandarakinum]
MASLRGSSAGRSRSWPAYGRDLHERRLIWVVRRAVRYPARGRHRRPAPAPDREPVMCHRCLKLIGHESFGEQQELFGTDEQDDLTDAGAGVAEKRT